MTPYEKEMHAKAMLLGMKYAPETHAFVPPGWSFRNNIPWLDACTLEPVYRRERQERRRMNKNPYWGA